MKKSIKKYSVIQFYPDMLTKEFINIGLIVYDDIILKIRMLSSDEIKHINCNFFSDKQSIENTIIYLQSEFVHLNTRQEFNIKLKSLYFDNFSFSKEVSFASEDTIDTELEVLYYRFIGKKFEKTEYILKKEVKKKEIIRLIDDKYSRKLSHEDDEYFDLLLIPNRGKPYPTIIGSLLNDGDTANAFKAYINKPREHTLFAYLNTHDEILKHKDKASHVRETLHIQMKMDVYDFSSMSSMKKSLDRLLVH